MGYRICYRDGQKKKKKKTKPREISIKHSRFSCTQRTHARTHAERSIQVRSKWEEIDISNNKQQ